MATEPDFSDSDQAWLDRLQGRTGAPPASPAEREADALNRALALERQVMQADPEIVAATSPGAQERRWQQLQFRLRREEAAARPAWRRWAPAGGALAAAVLVTVVLVQRGPGDADVYDEPPVMRGESTVSRVSSAHPRQDAESLAAALRAAGWTAALHQHRKVFSVDTVVASDTPPAALEALRRAGASPQPGPNRVEFAPR